MSTSDDDQGGSVPTLDVITVRVSDGDLCHHPESLAYVDLAAFDDDGNPLDVWPCPSCQPWHVHVLLDGGIFVREWHAADCEHYAAIVAETAED